VDPENRVSAHDLHVSVFQIERLVASRNPFAVALSDVLVKFCRGQVGYGGDAQRGGRGGGDSIVGKCVGGRLCVMEDRGSLDSLQDGRGDSNIVRGREVLGSESDGGFNLCGYFGSHLTLFFSLTLPNRLRDTISFLFIIPLQPCGMEFAKFLVHELADSDEGRWDEQHTAPLASY